MPAPPYSKEFRERVRRGVERGVKWLRARQQSSGAWRGTLPIEGCPPEAYASGRTALAALTLLKAGAKADDSAVARAFEYLARVPADTTYEAGVLLMALAAKYETPLDPFEDEALDAAGRHVATPTATARITAADRAAIDARVEFLLRTQRKVAAAAPAADGRVVRPTGERSPFAIDGAWGYPKGMYGGLDGPAGDNGWADVSNTQYALLGLEAAARCGAKVPAEVWLRALRRLVAWQRPDGKPVTLEANEVLGPLLRRWTEPATERPIGYLGTPLGAQPGSALTVSGGTTTAGGVGIALCVNALWGSPALASDSRQAAREALRDALAWLQANFRVDRMPAEESDLEGGARALFYYSFLYGLERLSTLAHVRFYGAHDGYAEAASRLLDLQNLGGYWMEESEVATCLALLCLRRSTARISSPVITPRDPPPATGLPSPPDRK